MQEIQLMEKELEFENAKLDQKKSEALELHKASLEIEIKKLQLLKSRSINYNLSGESLL